MKRLKEIFAEVMSIEEKDISDESSPENTESWDSFNSLILISELEKNFSLKFTTKEVMSVKNFKDIVEILKKYKVQDKLLS